MFWLKQNTMLDAFSKKFTKFLEVFYLISPSEEGPVSGFIFYLSIFVIKYRTIYFCLV